MQEKMLQITPEDLSEVLSKEIDIDKKLDQLNKKIENPKEKTRKIDKIITNESIK